MWNVAETCLKSKSDIANRLVNVMRGIQSVLDSYDNSVVGDGVDDKEKFSGQVDRLKAIMSKMKEQADNSNKLNLELKEKDAKMSKLKLQLKAKMVSLNSDNEKLKVQKEQYLNVLRSIDNIMFGMNAEKDDGAVQMDFLETLEMRISDENRRRDKYQIII